MTHFSLCSGIGGLDLAAEWAGFETVVQCEIDEYASKVLAKNFPGVPNLHDIRTVTNQRLRELGIDPEEIDVISAGFPCQPYSLAGKGMGDRDERDLWGEVARVLGEIKPRWFVGENTPGLFSRENQRFFRRILSDLTEMGYRVGWGIWGAYHMGAPHKRDRVFLLAHTYGERRRVLGQGERKAFGTLDYPKTETPIGAGCLYGNVLNANGKRRTENDVVRNCARKTLDQSRRENQPCGANRVPNDISDAYGAQEQQPQGIEQESGKRACNGSWWHAEPDVGRVAHGIPARVDRLRCLGNAVVPQQAYPIFEAIAEFEKSKEKIL